MASYFSDGFPFFTIQNSREVILEFYAWAHGMQDDGIDFNYRHLQFYDTLRPGGSPNYYLIVHPLNELSVVLFKLKYSEQLIADNNWYSANQKFYNTNIVVAP